MSETLTGTIERVTFHNEENGFAVLRVKVARRRDLVTVVGSAPAVQAGEDIEATGQWVTDRDHGEQFKADSIQITPPHSLAGITKFLGSGLIKGIGPHFAQKIVEVFGERTLQVIDESPSYLKEVKGLGPRRLQQIRESWRQQRAVRDLMVFLHANGIGTNRATRIYKTYGDQAITLIKANPYRMASDIWGIGFQTADQFALKLGVDPSSRERAAAALLYALQEFASEGHVGYPQEGVIDKAVELTKIGKPIVQEAIELARQAGEIVREPVGSETWLYLKPLFLAETGIARSLTGLQGGPHPLPGLQLDKVLAWVEKEMKLELAPAQRQAITLATQNKVLIITGGPGVGKTTLIRGILKIFEAKNLKCSLAAPTGRAAKRLTELTGKEAKTIHRLLEVAPGGGFKRGRNLPLEHDLLVVDEASMIDVSLMNSLLAALPHSSCLVLVGDVDQLPSVGPGTVLADFIQSGVMPVVRLTEIFRQAEASWIVRAAHKVNNGQMPQSAPPATGDFYFIEAATPSAVADLIVTLVRERISARFNLDSLRDIQVLTPMNVSELGTRNLCMLLQEALNPSQAAPQIKAFGWTFRKGDKVLQTANNYQKEVFNGDIGIIVALDEEEKELVVSYDGRKVTYDFNELDELALAYALTIHKSQGSEYPAVVIPVHTQHFVMLRRNLLYTGITRGKKLVVLVGTAKALSLAVSRHETGQRMTALCQRLKGDV